MNIAEAKETLQLYRPGSADAADRKVAEALALARRDPALAAWLEQHNGFQTAVTEKFRAITVPVGLKEKLLQQQVQPRKERAPVPVIQLSAWQQQPQWLKAVAAVIFFAGMTVLILGVLEKNRTPDRFRDYSSRMVRSALREYRMDLVTDDLTKLRRLAEEKGAPADFAIPPGLAQLPLTGGGILRWRNNPVSMICFNRGDDQMLFLFVMKRSAVKDPPSPSPELARVSKLAAVSWTEGENTYLLAGPEEAKFLEKYL